MNIQSTLENISKSIEDNDYSNTSTDLQVLLAYIQNVDEDKINLSENVKEKQEKIENLEKEISVNRKTIAELVRNVNFKNTQSIQELVESEKEVDLSSIINAED